MDNVLTFYQGKCRIFEIKLVLMIPNMHLLAQQLFSECLFFGRGCQIRVFLLERTIIRPLVRILACESGPDVIASRIHNVRLDVNTNYSYLIGALMLTAERIKVRVKVYFRDLSQCLVFSSPSCFENTHFELIKRR